jgi:hypothetical protein
LLGTGRRAGSLLVETGQFGEALKLYDALQAEVLPRLAREHESEQLALSLEHATALVRAGHVSEGEAACDRILHVVPGHVETCALKAELALGNRRWNDGLEQIRDLLTRADAAVTSAGSGSVRSGSSSGAGGSRGAPSAALYCELMICEAVALERLGKPVEAVLCLRLCCARFSSGGGSDLGLLALFNYCTLLRAAGQEEEAAANWLYGTRGRAAASAPQHTARRPRRLLAIYSAAKEKQVWSDTWGDSMWSDAAKDGAIAEMDAWAQRRAATMRPNSFRFFCLDDTRQSDAAADLA